MEAGEIKIWFTLTNVKDGIGRVQMRAKWQGGNLATNIGHEVTCAKWDTDTQSCIANTTHGKRKTAASVINKEIRRYRALLLESVEGLDCSASAEDVKHLLNVKLGKESERNTDLVAPAIEDFIRREGRLQMWTENNIRKYRTMKFSLEQWKSSLHFRDLDRRGLEDYYLFLQSQGKRNDTLDKYVKVVRAFLKWADKKGGYPVARDYAEFAPRIKKISKTIVWLTWEEVLLLYDADIPALLAENPNNTGRGMEKDDKVYDEVRDIFLLSCFTGMRFSDCTALRSSDVYGDRIHLTIQKTSEVVTIELNRYSRAILAKHKDRRDEATLLPFHPNVICNRYIKNLYKWLGLDAPTTVTVLEGNERKQETKPKHELITMHTGRRTFICNALEKGISPNVIMKWTGHKSYDEMKPYIDISDRAKESAMRLFDL